MHRPMLLPALAGLLLLAACGGPAAAPPSATPARVAPAALGPAQPPLFANGVLVPRDEIRLAFKVGGIVRRIDVHPGDRVRAGQVLAELERTEVEAQVEQARQLALKAQRDLARGRALHADQVIPLEQLQNLQTQAEVAEAQLRSAEYNGRHAQLVAPVDARVLRRQAEPRDTLPPGQVVLVLGGEASGLTARVGLADREIPRIAIGDRVEVRVDAWPDRVFAARLTEIAGAASDRSGLFDVEAEVDAGDAPLRAGMVARLQIFPARDAGELVHVPLGAILEGDGGKAQVYVLERDDKVVRREVAVAWIGADSVALRGGLEPGTRVVVSGAPFLRDGESVRIVP
jgi:membrane fusion protein, multidrug efflux system